MASITPKHYDDGDDFNPDKATAPDLTIPKSLPQKEIDVILTMVSERDGGTDDEC